MSCLRGCWGIFLPCHSRALQWKYKSPGTSVRLELKHIPGRREREEQDNPWAEQLMALDKIFWKWRKDICQILNQFGCSLSFPYGNLLLMLILHTLLTLIWSIWNRRECSKQWEVWGLPSRTEIFWQKKKKIIKKGPKIQTNRTPQPYPEKAKTNWNALKIILDQPCL